MKKGKSNKIKIEKASFKITKWIGTPQSIVIHTLLFISSFSLALLGFNINLILLVLTTAVSLEAIYLALFIQMTVNRNLEDLEDVEENLDEIQEDVENIEENITKIEENVDDIEEDIDQIQEADEKEEEEEKKQVIQETKALLTIEDHLQKLVKDMDVLQNEIKTLRNAKKV